MDQVLSVHPFLKSFVGAGAYGNYLPPQMVSMKDKERNKDKNGLSNWKKTNMDALESIARLQYSKNKLLIDNERLVNGEFLANDYIVDCPECEEEFFEPLVEISKNGGLPKFIKHYDMIGTAIKTQIEEFAQNPDTMNIVGLGEAVQNDRMAVQKDQLVKWMNEEIELNFQEYLKIENIDIDQEFEDEEEQKQFQAEIDKKRQERTPEEIGRYMKYSFKHFAEEWATFELEDQKERFKLNKLRRKEYQNYLVVGRRFRHLLAGTKGLNVEPVNYVNVFYVKSENTEFVQDGVIAGIIFIENAAGIINRYGESLTEGQIKSLEHNNALVQSQDRPSVDFMGNPVTYLGTDGNPYNKWMPSKSPTLNKIAPNLGMNWVTNTGQGVDEEEYVKTYVCTEAYWRSFKRIGRLCWINPETELVEVIKVDEDFVIPANIKVLKDATFLDSPIENTIVWTWIEEVWQGTKINTYNLDTQTEAIYINVKPCDYQGVSPYTMYNKKLPIVGQIANNQNTKSSTQLDILKPYQFLFNIVMNKAFKYVERSLGVSVAVGLSTIPNQKDWGGQDALFKWLNATEESMVMALDDSPSAAKNDGGQFPRVIDLDNTAKVVQLLNTAAVIKALALSQIGITPQRMGDMEQINTATGISESLAKSYNATGSWFTDFWECEADIMKQQLDVAQWMQSKQKDFTALLSKGIISESFLTNNPENFDLYDLRIYISNSQEELRQLNLYKKLGVENNTLITKMSTRMQMAGLNSAQIIMQVVKDEEDKTLQLQQDQQAFERQMQEAQTALEKEELSLKKYKIDQDNLTSLKEAYIKAFGFSKIAGQDADQSGTIDILEYDKFEAQAANDLAKLDLSKDKLALDRQRELSSRADKERDFELKFRTLELKKQQLEQTAKNVRILDRGKYQGK